MRIFAEQILVLGSDDGWPVVGPGSVEDERRNAWPPPTKEDANTPLELQSRE